MWCPKCRNEYIQGITTCVDCGSALVEELPEEIDPSIPQVIGTVENEEIALKFIHFFKVSGLQTVGIAPHEEGEPVNLLVAYPELERATGLIQGFLEEDSTENLDLEKILPILEEQLEEIQDEEAKKMLSDLRQEASTVYVSKKDRYADLTFSGYSFLVFAAIGYLLAGLNIAGVVSLFNTFSVCILFAVFTTFLCVGIGSLRQAARIRAHVKEEEQLLGQVEDYIDQNFTDDYLSSLERSDLSAEENFFHVTELLKEDVSEHFPLLSDQVLQFNTEFLNQLVDDKYGDYCDRMSAEISEDAN